MGTTGFWSHTSEDIYTDSLDPSVSGHYIFFPHLTLFTIMKYFIT